MMPTTCEFARGPQRSQESLSMAVTVISALWQPEKEKGEPCPNSDLQNQFSSAQIPTYKTVN